MKEDYNKKNLVTYGKYVYSNNLNLMIYTYKKSSILCYKTNLILLLEFMG